jgi:predicted DNA binding CopG/RHH family protein
MSPNPLKLDEEELQILHDFERGEFESIQHFRKEKRSLEAAARRTLQKDKRINIRISSRDLEKLQKTGRRGRDSLSDTDRQHPAQVCNWQAQGARLTLRCT